MFDHNRIKEYYESMKKLGVETLVFKESDYQLGYTNDYYYLDVFDSELGHFTNILEANTIKELEMLVACHFLNIK